MCHPWSAAVFRFFVFTLVLSRLHLATPQILPERFRQPLCTFLIAFAHAALTAIFDRNGQAALTRGMGCGPRPASTVPRQRRVNCHAAVAQWSRVSLVRLRLRVRPSPAR